jgi:hypothetical protein
LKVCFEAPIRCELKNFVEYQEYDLGLGRGSGPDPKFFDSTGSSDYNHKSKALL